MRVPQNTLLWSLAGSYAWATTSQDAGHPESSSFSAPVPVPVSMHLAPARRLELQNSTAAFHSGSTSSTDPTILPTSLASSRTSRSALDPTGTASSRSSTTHRPNTTESRVTTSTQPSTSTSTAPIWNLKGTSCYDLDHLKTGAEQWSAVDGDAVLQNFTLSFNNNYAFCRECMGWPLDNCPQSREGSAQFDQNCASGVRSVANGRWDQAAARFAGITADDDMSCGLEVSNCVAAATCEDATGAGPGTWSLVKSLSTLNDLLYNTYVAINDAQTYCNSQMDSFSSDFAPPPPPSNTAWFGLLNSFIGLVGGLMSIEAPEAGILIGFSGALTNSIISIAGGSSSAPADTNKPMGNIAQAAISSLENVTNALFQTGEAKFPHAPDGSTSISLTSMFANGQLMLGPTDYSQYQANLVENFKKALFQQTAVFTWKNLDSSKAIPYVTFEPGSCSSNANGGPLDNTIDDLDRSDTSVDFDGDCYYLLGAVINSHFSEEPCVGPLTTYTCDGNSALPGGKHSILTGSADQYAGLTLQDFVIPAVRGWQSAGKNNNYPAAGQGGSLIKDIQNPGVVTLPVCDYVNNASNPGSGCPVFGNVVTGTNVCATTGGPTIASGVIAGILGAAAGGNPVSIIGAGVAGLTRVKKRSRVMQRC